MKYRYVGSDGLLLIVDNKRMRLRYGQTVELDERKVKTSKLRRYMKPIEDEDTVLTGQEMKALKKLLKTATEKEAT